MMMTNNRNKTAFSSVHHVDDAQNMEYAHSCGGRPSSSSDEAQDHDRGIQKIDEAMTALTMTTWRGGGSGGVPTELRIPSSNAKENVRPNSSGKKKHWRKKANQDHQRREADGDDVGPTTTTADGGGVGNSAVDEATTKSVKALQLKTKKPIVVEISSSHQPQKKTPAPRRILPSMDFRVAAAPWSIDEDLASNVCGDGGEKEKKARPKKNNKKQWRKKSQAARKEDASGGGMDFSTNAGGASVLALLGQYPYVMPSAFDVYDGCTPHSCNQMTMAGGGEGYQRDQYNPSNFSSVGILPPMLYTGHHAYDEHYAYAATVAHVIYSGGAIVMPGGYYVPAIMNDQTVYYNQPNAATSENAPYYHHPSYSPYPCEEAEPSSSARRHKGDDDRGKSPLNINAHEFMPMPAFDPSKENNSEA
jgi:hypothetical protein